MTKKAESPAPEALTKARTTPDVVTVPDHTVLALEGSGSPDAPDFAAAVGVLYGLAYTMRFARKKADRPVFKVGPLAADWWAEGDDLPEDRIPDRDAWRWRVMMPLPNDATDEELDEAVQAATTKRGGKLEGSETAARARLSRVDSARYARVLHKGPYSTEPASFARIQALLDEEGLTREKRHTEVDLSDPSRTSEDKLKTVLLTRIVE